MRATIVLLIWLLPSAAFAQTKIALLIGNQTYDASVGMLKNSHNDIAVVGEALRAQNFEVLPPIKDASRSSILGGVRELVRRLNEAGGGAIGFVYYSGHGAAEKGTNINYLIPVNAKQPGTDAFWDDSLKLDDLLRLLDGARSAAKFVVFDARRNELRLPTKDTSKGLLPVAEQEGLFVAYASSPGRTATDRGDKSGVYAAALAAELQRPGLDHLNLFQNVKEAVLTSTAGVQQPWESNGLSRRVYLTEQPKLPDGRASRLAEAAEAWDRVKDTKDLSVLEAFAQRYKDALYAELARSRIETLRKQAALRPIEAFSGAPFDGIWSVKMVCPQMSNGISGFTLGFAAQVKNGVFHGDIGVEGQPGWRTLDGKIEPNGSALLKERGLHADPNPYKIKPGTPYSNDTAAQFDATRGTAKRVTGRQCDYTFTRYQVAAAKEDGSVPIDPPGTSLFDGSWVANAVSDCPKIQTWQNGFTITASKIEGEANGAKITGRVAADGSFQYTVPGYQAPKILGIFTGKLHDDTGTGTLKYPNCTGSITLNRLPPMKTTAGDSKNEEVAVAMRPMEAFSDAAFDGIWSVKIVCPQMSDGTLGYTGHFAAQVKNGAFHGDSGVEGKPGWRTLDGKIEPNGSALLKERGLITDAEGYYNPDKVRPGTPYAVGAVAQFDATGGIAKRDSGRQCDYTFVKMAYARTDAALLEALISEPDAARIAEFASKYHLLLPIYTIEAPGSGVPARVRNFQGVWVTDDDSGRRVMIIIERITSSSATGYHLYGPPLPTSYSQAPAGIHKIEGIITNNEMDIALPVGEKLKLRSLVDGKLFYSWQGKPGQTRNTTMIPLWRLADSVAVGKP